MLCSAAYGLALQPQARELEEAVLGALMLEKDAYSIISEILKPECFYEKSHEMIYALLWIWQPASVRSIC